MRRSARETSPGARWLAGAAALILGASAGCEAPLPTPHARAIAPILAEKMPIVADPPKLGDAQRRYKDSPVYIDGRRVGVFRILELPSRLPVRPQKLQDGRQVTRYRVAEYLEILGADLSRVKEIHFLGGRGRAAIVSGDELRKHRDDLLFSFTAGDRGKPRMHWPKMQINTTIDLIGALTVYIEKEPPSFDPKKRIFFFAPGKEPGAQGAGDPKAIPKEIEGIPYAPEEEVKGTRLYADGVLLGWLKRKTLPNSVLLPGAPLGTPVFSLRAYLESLGADLSRAREIELLQGDAMVARFAASVLKSEPELSFTLPRRSQGNLLLALPTRLAKDATGVPGTTANVRVSAILIHAKLPAPPREPGPLADLIEPEGAGSNGDQPGGATRANPASGDAAQDVQSEGN